MRLKSISLDAAAFAFWRTALFVFWILSNNNIAKTTFPLRIFLVRAINLSTKQTESTMSFFDKIKTASKSVVDAGAKTMLKVGV